MRLPSCCGTIGHSRRGDRPMGRIIRTRGVSMNRFARRLALALLLSCGVCAAHAQVVISQVYGGGGNSGATLKSDFIELQNHGSDTVSRSEEQPSELQSLLRNSYAVFCLK